ncbi:crossover junction endodeoxyribonuclease RuvC [uncultured Ferrovibrio sp.]|jgi:crossover junction endodeoxyribonuclease RuvC|uniref:crossover junction endodeoxyribonuclease RuvC n=1 Tax=uncultured Ferrovibrio sp. TaxID=1576913 RepID=UPI002629BAAE|nr:crossover junction endodeoxyribonuclease RuvC [uncultured Ferrovibrio sp.]
MRIIGLDPGLRATGWGIILAEGNRLSHVAHGTIRTNPDDELAYRLRTVHDALALLLAEWQPQAAAVEETFVNKNPASTLKLGQTRGVVLLAPAQLGLPVAEYAPTMVKKAVVGTGHADKEQVHAMVKRLLPGVNVTGADAADALAVAICHAHFAASARVVRSAEAALLRAAR